jgi:hypothetical protein
MRFLVFPPDRISAETAQRAYFCGPDRYLWQSRTSRTDEGLLVERSVPDSGYFYIPWEVAGRGELTLCTAWLMERDEPYHLHVELARGKLHQVRTQLAEWQAIGLTVSRPLAESVREAMHRFALAATAQHTPEQAAALADEAIAAAMDAADLLVEHYTQQALHTRLRQNDKLKVRLGINLGATSVPESVARHLRRACNLVGVPFFWRQIEANERTFSWDVCDEQLAWGEANALEVCGGPLMSFDDLSLPDWLGLWEGDLANLMGCVREFLQRVVVRYRGRVDVWHCAARINTGEVLSLSLEDRLRLAVEATQTVRQLDPATPAILSFDQPWAEYMNRTDTDPPLYVADALLRAGLNVDGLGLEINLGYYPGGSYVHDALDLSQLLDRWGLLGVPLYVFLTVPSGQHPDGLTRGPARPTGGPEPGGWSPRAQQQWAEKHLPLLLAKPQVQGVIWNQFRDSQPHFFPHGGVLDADDRVKPVINALMAVRRKYLV